LATGQLGYLLTSVAVVGQLPLLAADAEIAIATKTAKLKIFFMMIKIKMLNNRIITNDPFLSESMLQIYVFSIS